MWTGTNLGLVLCPTIGGSKTGARTFCGPQFQLTPPGAAMKLQNKTEPQVMLERLASCASTYIFGEQIDFSERLF